MSLAGVAESAGAETPHLQTDAATDELADMSLTELLEVPVVTATKVAVPYEQAPSIVTVFTAEDIHRIGARTLTDLLKYVPGFYEVTGQLERNFAIRGIHAASAQHFVVLIDGVPANDFLTSSSAPDTFALDFAERVEIIRGPGAALYGASALMGVINIITIADARFDCSRQELTVGTAGLFRVAARELRRLDKDKYILATAAFWRSSGTNWTGSPTEDVLSPKLGQNISDGLQPGENLTAPQVGVPTTVNAYGPSFDLFLKYDERQRFTIRANLSRNDFYMQRTYRQALIHPDAELQPPRYIRDRFVADVTRRWGSASEDGEILVRPWFGTFGHDMRSQRISKLFFDEAAAENTALIFQWQGKEVKAGVHLEYVRELPDFSVFSATTVAAGVQPEAGVALDYRMKRCYRDVAQEFEPSIYASEGGEDLYCVDNVMLREGLEIDPYGEVRSTSRPRFGDGDEQRLGFFSQLTTTLPGSVGLTLGTRFDTHSEHGFQFTPRVAVAAPIADTGMYAKALYSSAFVYPAFLYRTGNSLSDYQGNPDIKPQSIRSFEALLGYSRDMLRVEVNGYLNQVRDFITYDLSQNGRTGLYRFSNQGDLDVLGLEATAGLRFFDDVLRVDASGSYVKPLASTDDQFVVSGALGGPTKFPTWMGNLAVASTPLPWVDVHVAAFLAGQVKQHIADEIFFSDIAGTDGQPYTSKAAEDYNTRAIRFDAAASVTLIEGLKLGLGGSNLLDARHHRPGSVLVPYLMEGRTLWARLGYAY